MKAITIRGVDTQLEKELKDGAKEESVSVNQFILASLRKRLGLEKERTHTKEYGDLDFLFGVWSKKEYDDFENVQKDFSQIDGELWK